MLAAFENIKLTDGEERPNRATAGREWKDRGIQSRRKPFGTNAAVMDTSQEKTRCYNCSKFGHVSRDCKLPRREKGTCFKCGEKGHMITDCKSKQGRPQISCVHNNSLITNDFRKVVTIEIDHSDLQFQVKLDSLLLTQEVRLVL